jgi:hypothetical protein
MHARDAPGSCSCVGSNTIDTKHATACSSAHGMRVISYSMRELTSSRMGPCHGPCRVAAAGPAAAGAAALQWVTQRLPGCCKLGCCCAGTLQNAWAG